MEEEFSERLLKALKLRKIKPIDLANKLNVNRAIVSQYLSGRYKPNQMRIFEISEILKVNPAWLMGFNVNIDAELEKIEELDFNADVVKILEDLILEKLSDVDESKKKEILDKLGWELMSIAKEMK